MKRNKINYYFHILKRGEIGQRYHSSSIRRFRNHISTINWQDCNFKVFLRVNYGNGFRNEGIYENKEKLLFALDAFADPAIPKYLYDE